MAKATIAEIQAELDRVAPGQFQAHPLENKRARYAGKEDNPSRFARAKVLISVADDPLDYAIEDDEIPELLSAQNKGQAIAALKIRGATLDLRGPPPGKAG